MKSSFYRVNLVKININCLTEFHNPVENEIHFLPSCKNSVKNEIPMFYPLLLKIGASTWSPATQIFDLPCLFIICFFCVYNAPQHNIRLLNTAQCSVLAYISLIPRKVENILQTRACPMFSIDLYLINPKKIENILQTLAKGNMDENEVTGKRKRFVSRPTSNSW